MNITVTQDPTTGKYILRLDASLYKTSNCLRRVYYTQVCGLTTSAKDFKMCYGTAYHKFLQNFYAGEKKESILLNHAIDYYSQPDILIPETDWRTHAHLMATVMQYIEYYRKNGDLLKADNVNGEYLVEQKFAYPLVQIDNVEVLACGTIDLKGTYAGHKVLVDHKTTSLTGVDSYLASYAMSPQGMMYKMINDKLFPGENIGFMINGVFLNRTGKTTFKRSDIFHFSAQQMNRFEYHLLKRAEAIAENFILLLKSPDKLLTTGAMGEIFPPNFTCCDDKFGMCPFAMLCGTDKQADVEMMVENYFTQRIYNPLSFQE